MTYWQIFIVSLIPGALVVAVAELRKRRGAAGLARSAEHEAWREELAENTRREEVIAQFMGTKLGSPDVNTDVERIYELRERRVQILHALGWHDEADELADDTAQRKTLPWINHPGPR